MATINLRHTRELRIVNNNDDTVISLDAIQGLWTEKLYLALTDHTNWLIEFTDGYVAHGVFGRGEQATSALLPGFSVDVSAALDAE